MLREAGFQGEVTKIGVTRGYSTRHGAGPFVVEDQSLLRQFPEPHNAANEWQGSMRVGWLDLVALQYASRVAGKMDYISVTCLDRLEKLGELGACVEYKTPEGTSVPLVYSKHHDLKERAKVTNDLHFVKPQFENISGIDHLLKKIAGATGAPTKLLSFGPTAAHKHFHDPSLCSTS